MTSANTGSSDRAISRRQGFRASISFVFTGKGRSFDLNVDFIHCPTQRSSNVIPVPKLEGVYQEASSVYCRSWPFTRLLRRFPASRTPGTGLSELHHRQTGNAMEVTGICG